MSYPLDNGRIVFKKWDKAMAKKCYKDSQRNMRVRWPLVLHQKLTPIK